MIKGVPLPVDFLTGAGQPGASQPHAPSA